MGKNGGKKKESNELNKEKERESRRNLSVERRRKRTRRSKLLDRRAQLTLAHLVALASTLVDTFSIVYSWRRMTFTKNRRITTLQLQKSQKCQARLDRQIWSTRLAIRYLLSMGRSSAQIIITT